MTVLPSVGHLRRSRRRGPAPASWRRPACTSTAAAASRSRRSSPSGSRSGRSRCSRRRPPQDRQLAARLGARVLCWLPVLLPPLLLLLSLPLLPAGSDAERQGRHGGDPKGPCGPSHRCVLSLRPKAAQSLPVRPPAGIGNLLARLRTVAFRRASGAHLPVGGPSSARWKRPGAGRAGARSRFRQHGRPRTRSRPPRRCRRLARVALYADLGGAQCAAAHLHGRSRPRAGTSRGPACTPARQPRNARPRGHSRGSGGGRGPRWIRHPASPEGAALVPVSNGVDGALGQVVSAAVVAMWDGTWRRLKACPRSVCQWAFYDRSTNASATWCSMSICGGRVKANRDYRRSRRRE